MRKLWFSMIFLAAVILSACAPRTAPTATVTSTEAPQALASVPTENPALPKMECKMVSLLPTPGPTEVSLFPPTSAADWAIGSPNAAMTITEYSDFQCPYCAQFSQVAHELLKAYPNDVRLVFRYFPLPSHPLSLVSANAAEAAGRQGKFWEMEERLFSQQDTWSLFPEDQFKEWVTAQAKDLGLDVNKFQQDMSDPAVSEKVNASQKYAMDIQIPGTPFLLINGLPYQGPRDFANLEAITLLVRLQERQYTYCPPMEIDPAKQYIATIKTEKGDIRVQLLPDKAPMAVNSFVFLARNGWFDNTTFHQVIANSKAQGGDPSGIGYGNPGYYFDNEITDLKFDKEGLLAMYNDGPGSNGSQFFITYGPNAQWDGSYTIFGEVIAGMDVAKKLTPRDPSQTSGLPDGDKVLTITIEEK